MSSNCDRKCDWSSLQIIKEAEYRVWFVKALLGLTRFVAGGRNWRFDTEIQTSETVQLWRNLQCEMVLHMVSQWVSSSPDYVPHSIPYPGLFHVRSETSEHVWVAHSRDTYGTAAAAAFDAATKDVSVVLPGASSSTSDAEDDDEEVGRAAVEIVGT